MKQNAKPLNISSDELIEELEKTIKMFDRRPPGFGVTIQDLITKGYSDSTARRFLNRAVDKLGWKKQQMKNDNNHTVWVYYK